jgi:dynein heavy chain
VLLEFFEKADARIIVFFTDAKDQLICSLKFPSSLKKKAVFFRKKTEFTVNAESVKTLEAGDMSYSAVEQVSALVSGVVLPVLKNQDNTSHWPGVVSKDVVSHANVSLDLFFHEFFLEA